MMSSSQHVQQRKRHHIVENFPRSNLHDLSLSDVYDIVHSRALTHDCMSRRRSNPVVPFPTLIYSTAQETGFEPEFGGSVNFRGSATKMLAKVAIHIPFSHVCCFASMAAELRVQEVTQNIQLHAAHLKWNQAKAILKTSHFIAVYTHLQTHVQNVLLMSLSSFKISVFGSPHAFE